MYERLELSFIQEMDEDLERQNLSLDRINLKSGVHGRHIPPRLIKSPILPPSLQVAVADVSTCTWYITTNN